MQLSAETFLQIVKSLRSDTVGNGGREQRKMPRVGVRGRSTILMPGKTGQRPHTVNVRDISAGGIGLLMTEPLLSVGEEFVLVLPSTGQQGKRQMLCVVARFNKLSANLYTVGASFKHEVPEAGKPATAKGNAKPVPSSEGLSQELLDKADQPAVAAVEDRLKKLSA